MALFLGSKYGKFDFSAHGTSYHGQKRSQTFKRRVSHQSQRRFGNNNLEIKAFLGIATREWDTNFPITIKDGGNRQNARRLAESNANPIDPYRAAPRPIVIVIVGIVLINVDLVLIAIAIESGAAFFDETYLFCNYGRNHICKHWFAFFTPFFGKESFTQT